MVIEADNIRYQLNKEAPPVFYCVKIRFNFQSRNLFICLKLWLTAALIAIHDGPTQEFVEQKTVRFFFFLKKHSHAKESKKYKTALTWGDIYDCRRKQA